MEAVKRGEAEGVRNALARGASANAKDEGGVGALIWAARYGYADCAAALMEKGADVNATDKSHGFTALLVAAWQGRTGTLKLLMEKGADVNAVDARGNTARFLARKSGHTNVERLLKAAGAKK